MVNVKELDSLPEATLEDLYRQSGEAIEKRKGVFEGDQLVAVVSPHYTLVQHKDAFGKALLAMEVPNDAKVNFYSRVGRASMNVFFNELKIDDKTKGGIELGFQVWNSYDKSTSLGLQVKRANIIDRTGEKYIVFMGLRQVCSNGMKIRVPLSEMTPAEIDKLSEKDITAVEKTGGIERKVIDSFRGSVKHMGNVEFKYANLLSMAKAAVPYIENKIADAKKGKITVKEFEEWMKSKGFRQNSIDKILEEYEVCKEGKTIWGAYNCITSVASHKTESELLKGELIDRAWAIMERAPVQGARK
jgi:hypothetical protein